MFTCIGNISINKGFDKLLSAFSSFSKTGNVYLNIIGDGPERNNLKQLAKEIGIEDQVIFHGLLNRTRILDVLRQSNVLVSTSNLETFWVTLIEVLSCGIPVVATWSGGLKKL